MRTEIRDRKLYVEGDSRVYTRGMIRGLNIAVSDLKFQVSYSRDDDTDTVKRKLTIAGNGHLHDDYLAALGSDTKTNHLLVEIHNYDADHYKKYGDAWSYPEWGGKVIYFADEYDGERFYIVLSLPLAVMEEMQQPIMFGKINQLSLIFSNEELWVDDRVDRYELDPSTTIFIKPDTDQENANYRANIRFDRINWHFTADEQKPKAQDPDVELKPEATPVVPSSPAPKKAGWFR
jgi:hypothetical protein